LSIYCIILNFNEIENGVEQCVKNEYYFVIGFQNKKIISIFAVSN